ncbi:MAG: hypothetical protein WBB45_08920 [Cyclobacteriaceae bacterium]
MSAIKNSPVSITGVSTSDSPSPHYLVDFSAITCRKSNAFETEYSIEGHTIKIFITLNAAPAEPGTGHSVEGKIDLGSLDPGAYIVSVSYRIAADSDQFRVADSFVIESQGTGNEHSVEKIKPYAWVSTMLPTLLVCVLGAL